jgi:predicted Zn finger-like uncharacterized protein
MQILCPECDKKLKVADDLAGKKVRCPGCKTTIPVSPVQDAIKPEKKPTRSAPPSEAKPKPPPREDDDDTEMRCPKCDAAAVETLPPNWYSRNPGFVCAECGALMRPPGSTGFYIFATLLGGFIVLVGIGLLIAVMLNDVLYVRAITGGVFVSILGVSVAGWALKQMRLPIPLNAPPAPSRVGLWIGVLLFIFVGLSCIGGTLFVGFMYYIKEMM